MNILERIDTLQQSILSINRQLQRAGLSATDRASDRLMTGSSKSSELGKASRIVYGRIVDGVAAFHWYKVQVEGAKTPIACSSATTSGLLPFGVRDHNPITIGSGVWVLMHPQSIHGVIIGVDPGAYPAGGPLADMISQSSRNGLDIDRAHSFPFSLSGKGGITDWSAGRPSDATFSGEKGWFGETGTGLFVDSMMAFLRADENCGFWAFYDDQLARLAGHNHQVWTGGSIYEILDDQGEIREYRGVAPYSWENMGFLRRDAVRVREFSAQQSQIDQPHYSRFEPLYDDQVPFHRLREYGGYSGDVSKKQVVLPPSGEPVLRLSDSRPQFAVFEEHVAANGRYTLRSAKGVTISKSFFVPAPREIRRPEDPSGDTPNDYRFAGLGNGAEHNIIGDLDAGTIHPQEVRLAGDLDTRAAASNWDSLLGQFRHEKDTSVPQASSAPGAGSASRRLESLSGNSSLLDPPIPVEAYVDHREAASKYYNASSDINLAEDGGLSFNDAYGASLRSTGGNLELSAPGDIIVRPGRRFIVMAGSDVVIRTANGMEISTTNGDVRISSGRHSYIAAEGGVLVESRSPSEDFSKWKDQVGDDCAPSGIILRSPSANVTVWAATAYISAGNVTVDAGLGSVTTYSSSFDRYMSKASDLFGEYTPTGQRTDGVSQYTAAGASISGDLFVENSVQSRGTVVAREGFFTPDGRYEGGQEEGQEERARSSRDDLNASNNAMRAARTSADREHARAYVGGWHGESGAGNALIRAEAAFSFRTSTQYGADDFHLFETRWQQQARAWGSSLSVWREKYVTKSGQPTGPFPGFQRSYQTGSYFTQDLKLHDLNTGLPVDRTDESYNTGKHGTPSGKTLDGNYTIIG